MLATATPFPQPGSYALLCDDDDRHLIRIHQHVGEHASVSFPLRPGSAGNRTVAVTDLADPTPLTAAEEAELDQLNFSHPKPRTKARARQLELSGRREAATAAAPLFERLKRLQHQAAAMEQAAVEQAA